VPGIKEKKAKLVVSLDESEAKLLRQIAIEDDRDVSDMIAESLRACFGGRELHPKSYPVAAVAS